MAYGTNAQMMKDNNRKLLLNLIRQGTYSRAELAKKLRLTKATISILTDELLQEGWITEEVITEYTGIGRRPILLHLRERARYVVGLGLTRSEYLVGLYDISGYPVVVEKHPYLSESQTENLRHMAEVIDTCCKKVPPETLLGIGVAAPGPIEYSTGVMLNPPNFPVWHNCPFQEMLASLCNLPVKVENIANAMAMAEQYFGSCKQEKNFAYIVVDEGIGAGIIVDGKIYRGNRGFGNELGHISIAYDGRLCSCGNRGCLERYAAIPDILSGTPYQSWREVVSAGDNALISREAAYLSCGIVSLLNLFDLCTVVLGGTLCEEEDSITEKISRTVNAQTIIRHPIRIVPSEAGHERALAGASVALHQFLF